MALETSPESPTPVRTVLQLVGGWISKLGRIWVEGQITELNRRAGTVYFTLRDPVANVSVRVVCPRTVCDAGGPAVIDGARVVVHAKPDFYINRGSFALSALEIRPVGVGELLARLERLKQLLAAEGVFNAERKRPLPFLPAVIGLICGRDSAAERDVLDNARRRWPAVRFKIENVAVQGTYAAGEVIDALSRLDADREVEVVIIARGGGSLEDLLAFSDEALVRAVAAARTPVVSAIGHEQDTPLLDYVADVRASTPTDAAKRIVPDVSEERARLTQARLRARAALTHRLTREQSGLDHWRSRPVLANPTTLVDVHEQRVDALRESARRSLHTALVHGRAEVAGLAAQVRALSPAATLDRGYAVVQGADGHVVRDPADVAPDESLRIRVARGELAATVAPA
jgi:exodeoxyribonuclease VII large subunit